jgi:hypothetical protein
VTDFIAVSIWLVLSSIMRQIDNGIDNLSEDTNETGTENLVPSTNTIGADAAGADVYEPAVQIIKVGIAAFSVLLLGLSLSAYKKTALKSIIYAAAAFGLFAAQLFFDYLEDAVAGFDQPFNDVIFYAMTLAILVLFFLAIVRRK